MHHPPHPGTVPRDTIQRPDGGLSVTGIAKRLKVSRALSRVVHGYATTSAELAVRVATALGGSAESWLKMPVAYDRSHAAQEKRPKIQKTELNTKVRTAA